MLNKISSKINFIGGALSFVVIMNVILTIYLTRKQEGDSYIINIAGRQRMLSQKITKEVFYTKSTGSFNFETLNSDMKIFQKNLYILINGNKKLNVYKPPNKEIQDKLKQVLNIWVPFQGKIKKLEQYTNDIKKSKEIMMDKFNEILKISDKVVKAMVDYNLPGSYIDLSGRQRMLSQRMGLYFIRYLNTSNQNDFYIYSKSMKLYNNTIIKFANNNKIKSNKNLYKIVSLNYKYWKNFQIYIKNLMEKENKIQRTIKYIHENNIKLLKNMNDAVWLYTSYSESKNNFIKNFLYISGVLALLIILYTYMIAKNLEKHVLNFVSRAKELSNKDPISENGELTIDFCGEDELKEVSTHINKFANKVKNAYNYSNEALKRAELAAKELQIIADDIEMAIDDSGVKDKKNFGKNIDATEDIAIESAESLLHVSNMIKRLKENLSDILNSYSK